MAVGSACFGNARSTMPRMAFIGVRSSWLMLARNRLLASLAASAARACCSKDLQQADALHGDGHVVGHRLHQRQFVLGKRRLGPRAERKRSDDLALVHQRVAGVCLDAEGADQIGAGSGVVWMCSATIRHPSRATQPHTAAP